MSGGAVATSGCSCTWGRSCRGLFSDGDSPAAAKSAAAAENGGGSAAEPPGGCRPLFVALRVASTISPAWVSRRTHARGRGRPGRRARGGRQVSECVVCVCVCRCATGGVRRWSLNRCPVAAAFAARLASWCRVVQLLRGGRRTWGWGASAQVSGCFAERVP